uniref:Putative lipocalin-6 1 n=1 Tax=Amblyomma triste TaxID=251400 RepID=A0A023GEC0_AMBTT
MYFIAVLCVYACFAEKTAAESAACSAPNGVKDGFSLLQVGKLFRLVQTNFATLSRDNVRCIVTTTTQRNEARHEVTEYVRYMAPLIDTYSFIQRFQFSCESGEYNIMTSIDNDTAVPHASYKFLSTKPDCAIVEYLVTPMDQAEQVQPQAREGATDGAKQAHHDCMLWVEGLGGEASEECLSQFNTLCGSIARQSFTTRGCDVLYNQIKEEWRRQEQSENAKKAKARRRQ